MEQYDIIEIYTIETQAGETGGERAENDEAKQGNNMKKIGKENSAKEKDMENRNDK